MTRDNPQSLHHEVSWCGRILLLLLLLLLIVVDVLLREEKKEVSGYE